MNINIKVLIAKLRNCDWDQCKVAQINIDNLICASERVDRDCDRETEALVTTKS